MTTKDVLALALEALELAMDNLRPHGDNCFLHDEGEYNACFCGKDSLADHLQSVVENLAAITAIKQAEPAQDGMADAYTGAREDLAIWKRRALEAEELNRKFAREVNGPTFMGEPAPKQAEPKPRTIDLGRYAGTYGGTLPTPPEAKA